MSSRLWMFNPGCASVPCCDDQPEDCGELCITMTQGTPSVASSGVSLTGPTGLGSCVTDSAGKCCFTIPGTGTYHFTATKSGFITESFDVNVSSGDCDGTQIIKAGPHLDPVTIPPGCIDVFLYSCGQCLRPGVPVTFTYGSPVTWTVTATSQTNGRIRICPPNGARMTGWQAHIPGDGGPQIDTVIDAEEIVLNPTLHGNEAAIAADKQAGWFCHPGFPFHCMTQYPPQLFVTFGPAWPAPLGGYNVTLNLYESLVLEARYISDRFNLAGGADNNWQAVDCLIDAVATIGNLCGNRPSATSRRYTFEKSDSINPTTNVAYNYDQTFGTTNCPVNMRYYLVQGGVSFPDLYYIITE